MRLVIESPPSREALERAELWLREAKYDEVRRWCREVLAGSPDHPQALHLLGLAQVRDGAVSEGEQHLRRSLELEPDNTLFRFNVGSFLRRANRLAEAESEFRAVLARRPTARKAREQLALTLDDLGRPLEAESECRRLLEDPGADADAWAVLGQILTHLERPGEAELAYRRALEIAPGHAGALRQRGALLNRLERPEEALQCFERAASAGTPLSADVAAGRGRALMLLGRLEEAEQCLAQAVAERPRHLDAQLHLLRLRYLRGDPFFTRTLEAAARAMPAELNFESILINCWLRAGRPERAEARIRELIEERGALPALRSLRAQALLEAGRYREAESEALEAVTALPREDRTNETLVAALLARGRLQDALPFIEARRRQEPTLQHWIAYEALNARLQGSARYAQIYDYPHLVRAYRIEAPAGFTSVQAFNALLLERLRARFIFNVPPLDHPIRGGVRTERNLVTDPDPVLAAAFRSFEAPVRHYLAAVGHQPDHPFLAHNAGALRVHEAWAVRLDPQGEVRNHVHSHGWLAGTYFVSIPAACADTTQRPGWLTFGEPRYPVPGAGPDFMVQPGEGTLVLYPACFWHGVRPLSVEKSRVSLSFDALPLVPASP